MKNDEKNYEKKIIQLKNIALTILREFQLRYEFYYLDSIKNEKIKKRTKKIFLDHIEDYKNKISEY